MRKDEWYEWQKSIIRSDEYKDITPAKKAAEESFNKTVKWSLAKVKRHGS